jgi:Uma2 family endonuclease
MGQAAAIQGMSAGEYLAWERDQRDKHEYHLGEVFAMAGGSPRHNFLSGAVIAELRTALRGKGCYPLTSDQRISARQGERYVYADAVAVCGAARMEPGTSDVLANPSVIVEVLSRSTEAYDRGDKWEAYQRLPSLTDYLLVSQGTAQVEHFQREEGGSWRYRLVEPGGLGAEPAKSAEPAEPPSWTGGTIILASGATLSIDAIYEDAFDLDAD